MQKRATFDQVRNGMGRILAQSKTAQGTHNPDAISKEQGTQENKDVPAGKRDPEVSEITPSGPEGVSGGKTDLATSLGVDVFDKLPGQPSPKEEEEKRKEVSPETTLEKISQLRLRLASSITSAAQKVAAGAAVKAPVATPAAANPKAAEAGLAAPGSDDPGTVPPIPKGGPDLSQGLSATSAKNEAGKVKMDGVAEVTETDPHKGRPSEKEPQGTKQEKVGGVINVDELAAKIAQGAVHYETGHKVGALLSAAAHNMLLGMDFSNQEKVASFQQDVTSRACNELMDLGISKGIISQQQAATLMKEAGFQPHPVILAINDFREKVAKLQAAKFTADKAGDFMLKSAAMMQEGGGDPAAAMAAGTPDGGGQPPVDPQAMGGSIQELLKQLDAAIQAGKITPEQAEQVLREQGVPIDQILAQAGGGGADPSGAAGAGGPIPDGGAGPMGGGAPGGAAPGGMPAPDPGVDPNGGAAAALGGAIDPSAGGGAPPMGGGATPPPMGGDGGGAAPKKEEGGKSEGKKEDKGEKGEKKKDDQKKEDDKGDSEKEALLNKVAATFGFAAALALHKKAIDGAGIEPEAMTAADPSAGPGSASAADLGGGAEPAPGGGADGDPAAMVQEMLADIQQLVQTGQLDPAKAEQIKAELQASLQGGGAAGGGTPPPGPEASAGPAAAGLT